MSEIGKSICLVDCRRCFIPRGDVVAPGKCRVITSLDSGPGVGEGQLPFQGEPCSERGGVVGGDGGGGGNGRWDN